MKIISSRNFSPAVNQKTFKVLDLWKTKIENGDNFSFIKFGDGEFLCMGGDSGKNCDNHPYSKDLGDKLFAAWFYFNSLDNIYVSQWSGFGSDIVAREV